MNVLDENIPAGQRQLLVSWRIRVRQIGFDIGRRGMQDDEIIAFLLRMRRPTFFTRDDDFYARQLCHAAIAWCNWQSGETKWHFLCVASCNIRRSIRKRSVQA